MVGVLDRVRGRRRGAAVDPIIGPIIGLLLAPILVAGLMLGAHDVQEGRPLTVGHVFAGFRTNSGALILTAVIQVGLIIAIGAAIFFLMGQRLMSAAMALNEKDTVTSAPSFAARTCAAVDAAADAGGNDDLLRAAARGHSQ